MWIADQWRDYELLDCGGGERLERWDRQYLVRPDPQAIWETPHRNPAWDRANARYLRSQTGGGHWEKGKMPESWLMRNIALRLMYNGTAYHGWQVQKNAVTVCETLQRAITRICGEPVHLTGCGRTDAGVHAERYVANFRTESAIPLERLPFAINTHTPVDIAVESAFAVAEDFNAIGSCRKKEYTYRIYNSRFKNPFYVNRAYFYPKRLDEEFLNRAGHMEIIGSYDHPVTQVRATVEEEKIKLYTL